MGPNSENASAEALMNTCLVHIIPRWHSPTRYIYIYVYFKIFKPLTILSFLLQLPLVSRRRIHETRLGIPVFETP